MYLYIYIQGDISFYVLLLLLLLKTIRQLLLLPTYDLRTDYSAVSVVSPSGPVRRSSACVRCSVVILSTAPPPLCPLRIFSLVVVGIVFAESSDCLSLVANLKPWASPFHLPIHARH
jgi:hypothetical protein